jgi:hypothetical protein
MIERPMRHATTWSRGRGASPQKWLNALWFPNARGADTLAPAVAASGARASDGGSSRLRLPPEAWQLLPDEVREKLATLLVALTESIANTKPAETESRLIDKKGPQSNGRRVKKQAKQRTSDPGGGRKRSTKSQFLRA